MIPLAEPESNASTEEDEVPREDGAGVAMGADAGAAVSAVVVAAAADVSSSQLQSNATLPPPPAAPALSPGSTISYSGLVTRILWDGGARGEGLVGEAAPCSRQTAPPPAP